MSRSLSKLTLAPCNKDRQNCSRQFWRTYRKITGLTSTHLVRATVFPAPFSTRPALCSHLQSQSSAINSLPDSRFRLYWRANLCLCASTQHGISCERSCRSKVAPWPTPSKVRAGHCQPLPDSAAAEKKKAPEIRGLAYIKCSGLLAVASREITPTQSSPAASPKYHKQPGSNHEPH